MRTNVGLLRFTASRLTAVASHLRSSTPSCSKQSLALRRRDRSGVVAAIRHVVDGVRVRRPKVANRSVHLAGRAPVAERDTAQCRPREARPLPLWRLKDDARSPVRARLPQPRGPHVRGDMACLSGREEALRQDLVEVLQRLWSMVERTQGAERAVAIVESEARAALRSRAERPQPHPSFGSGQFRRKKGKGKGKARDADARGAPGPVRREEETAGRKRPRRRG